MELFKAFGTLALEGMDAVKSGLSEMEAQGKSATDKIASFGKGMQATGDSMSKWVTGPLVAGVTGLVAMTAALGNTADSILDAAATTGLSTTAVQSWATVAGRAGTSTEAMQLAAIRLNREMEKVKEGTGPAADAIKRLGINTAEFGKLNTDQQLEAIVSGLQRIKDPVERARIGTELFSRQWAQIAPIVDLGAEALNEAKAAGDRFAMNEDQLVAANNFRIRMVELREELSYAGREIMLSLLPVIDRMAAFLIDKVVPAVQAASAFIVRMVDAFAALPEPVQTGIGLFLAFVAAVGPALSIAGRLMQAFGMLRGAAIALGVAKSVVTAAFLALSPAMLPVIAALAAVGVAVYLAIKYWDEIKAAASFAVESIVAAWDWAGEKLSGAFASIMDAAGKAADWVVGVWDDASGKIAEIFNSIFDGATSLGGSVWDALKGVGSSIGGVLSDAWKAAKDFALGLPGMFNDAVQDVKRIFVDLYNGVVGSIRDMAKQVGDRIRNMVKGALDSLKSLYKQAVGNSIIPDLARDVVKEMGGMADDSIHETDRMRSGVEKALPSGTAGMSGSGGMAGGVTVDMRHAVIRDDRDMLQRMYRKGVGLTGAFA